MNTKQIQERIETLTVRMDAAARKSSADPVIQRRLNEEIDAAWAEIRELEAGSAAAYYHNVVKPQKEATA